LKSLKKEHFYLPSFSIPQLRDVTVPCFQKQKWQSILYEKHHLHPLLPVLRSLAPKCRSAISSPQRRNRQTAV
jgi:hypothetical protein